MAIELYWGSGSPFVWRVMLTLEVKGLGYESKLLEFSKGEHKTTAYFQLNPRGKVPTLKDGDFAVYESIAIMVNEEDHLRRSGVDETDVGRLQASTRQR